MRTDSPRKPHRRYLHRRSQRRNSSADTETKGISRIQNQIELSSDVSRTADDRDYSLAVDSNASFKKRPGNAFLPPDLSFFQFPVGIETRKLCTRARSARRA